MNDTYQIQNHTIAQVELIAYPRSQVGVRPSSVNHFQRSSPPKPLGQSKPNSMWSPHGKGEQKFTY